LTTTYDLVILCSYTEQYDLIHKKSKTLKKCDPMNNPNSMRIQPDHESRVTNHDYHILKEIEKNPSHTQRSLAEKLDISLGKVNFVLSGLIEKGIIKAKKLKNHPDKIRWQYILTPEGLKEKVRITKDYMNRRLREFELLKAEIEELEKEVTDTD
jgi:EPS-associated MarR family transcriptional regulator